jgi:hypothetical protein
LGSSTDGQIVYSNLIEFYVSLFFKHLYFDSTITRDIQIVDSSDSSSLIGLSKQGGKNSERKKYDVMLSYRNN